MNPASLLRLLVLAAIWGVSFLFMRIAASVLGAAILIEFRVGIAALFLTASALTLGRPLPAHAHWRHYFVLGLVNSGLPFLLLAFAAQTLNASLLAILNATAPLFGALVGALWLRCRPTVSVIVDCVLGILGVAILVGYEPFAAGGVRMDGIAGIYAKQAATSLDPFANAHGSMWAATVLVALIVPWSVPPQAPTVGGAVQSRPRATTAPVSSISCTFASSVMWDRPRRSLWLS